MRTGGSGILVALLLVGCAAEPDPVVAALEALLRESPNRIIEIDPIVVHPNELLMYGDEDPTPGMQIGHYREAPWDALAAAATAVGVPICQPGPEGYCPASGDRGGFIAVGAFEMPTADSAQVWVVATELGGHGYAARFYKVGLRARADSGWTVTQWRPRGSAN